MLLRGMCGSRDGGEFERVYQGPLQLVEVSNLRSGYTYRFRVTAFNEASALLPLLPACQAGKAVASGTGHRPFCNDTRNWCRLCRQRNSLAEGPCL